MNEKESRIKSIVSIYYSNPKVQEALFEFAKDREVVPSYMMESFGKRPDTFQYPSDIMAAVKKGATSFHASEELWKDSLQLSSEISYSEMNELRKSWDLLIDVDSPFLDYSKIATKLLANALESHGVKSYGLKYSGSKGFHIIVPSSAFPEEFQGEKTRVMFPEWPRAICGYLMEFIKPEYNRAISDLGVDFKAIKERTNLSEEEITSITCPSCGKNAKKTNLVYFKCEVCKTPYARPNYKIINKKLRCNSERCPGFYEVVSEKEYFFCENCKTKLSINEDHNFWKVGNYNSTKTVDKETKSKFSENFEKVISGSALGSLDLVLVAPRHLFRMPYSLHEKTALASIVLTKDQLNSFVPKDANPLKVEIKRFYPKADKDEAENLLASALRWKKEKDERDEKETKKKYESVKFENIDFSEIDEKDFPSPIKNLLLGLKDGRKRGLFILLTFLRSLNYPPEKINEICREWNKKNEPELREGYLRSQIDWHLRQKRKILPPNYSNQSFYRDLKLFDAMPDAKNPLSEMAKKIKKRR